MCVTSVGNFGLLSSQALDLIRFMQLSLRFSRSNTTKIYNIKNHIIIQLQRLRNSCSDLDVPKSNLCSEKETNSLQRSYIQSLPPNDSDHNLSTPNDRLQKGGSFGSLSLKVEDDIHTKSPQKPKPLGGIYRVPLLGLSDLSPYGLGSFNLA